MPALIEFLSYIPGPVWFIAAIVLSWIARALPEPLPNGSRFYQFVYNFAHIALANKDLIVKAKNGNTQSIVPKG
jgi:hypothetical protein